MLAFSLGIIVGALGGLLFLGCLAGVIRKEELLEVPDQAGDMPSERSLIRDLGLPE